MNPEQIAHVTVSYQHVVVHEDAMAALFYGRLFELDPQLRLLFHTDMRVQGHRFTDMLFLIVDGLQTPQQFLPELRELGARHREYGVRAEHYATVGAALLWALQQGLDEHFTPGVEQAWRVLYQLLTDTMHAGWPSGDH